MSQAQQPPAVVGGTPTPSALETGRPAASPQVQRQPPGSPLRRWLWLLVLVLLGAGAYYYGWPLLKPAQVAKAPADPAARKGRGLGTIPVVAARAQRGSIGVYVTALGAVTPLYTVTLKSRVDGQLMRVLYKEGETVHQGDLLVEIDPRPYEVQLEQAEGQLARDQANLANARVDLARYETLLTQNAIPEQQVATQKSTVAQYEGTVKSDQGQIDMAKLNIVYCHITAPITGRVGLRLVDPGNIVHASDNNGLLVITQVEPISVIFPIAEGQLPPVLQKMRAGQHLRVEAWDQILNKKLAQGTLTTIDNQIDQTTGTVKLRALFENQKDSLFPNQFVNVRLLVEEKSGVTLVPNAAVQRNSLSTYVYLVQPDRTVTVRQVTPGTAEGDLTQIVTGLSPGAVVVTEGVDKLQEGTRVNPRIGGEKDADASGGAPGKPSGAGGVPSKGRLPQGANSPKAR